MLTPVVVELPRRLEPVTRDMFAGPPAPAGPQHDARATAAEPAARRAA
jgi:hypothetical protein